ncbi:MAG: ABC transporter ATP-binding protein [Mycoplasmataceae bacterium]|jgi:ABC-2 type transport system ATP-binding protein|nr:ABC transporter ATP-binding protein [Mycoplasmataceae bacterium]
MNRKIRKNKKVLVELKCVKKVFGKKHKQVIAINNLSFKLYEGENVALIGANGAGKTTTVEMIMGINKPTQGRVIYSLSEKSSKRKHNLDLGIQFQDSIYPQYIYVKDIVNFIINAYNISIDEKTLEGLVKAFKVDNFYTHRANSLSGGQSQRLNILLAFLHKPKLVFLDELSTGLDITTRNDFKKFIKDYAIKNNITIVLISHDSGEIMSLTDKIIILKNGSIVKEVKTKDFKNINELEKFIELNIN